MSDGKNMIENLRKVCGLYRNVASMLLSADDILRDRQFFSYDWECVYQYGEAKLINFVGGNKDLAPLDTPKWLPEFVVRQYYHKERDQEVFTVGAVLYLENDNEFEEPLAIASLIEGRAFDDYEDDIYWISVLQAFDRKKRGKKGIVEIDVSTVKGLPGSRNKIEVFQANVKPGRFTSNVQPLLQVTDSQILKENIITPLLGT
jgi:hypothetical protein